MVRQLPVDQIQRGRFQPRLDMRAEALQELADSIRTQGLVQPIIVRPLPAEPGRYEIIAGERRWRAAQMAGLHEIPVVVRDVPDRTALCLALIENIQREDLNPIEEARALQRLLDEFDMTHEAVAEAVGRSRSAVTNLLRLLELQPEVRRMVEQGELEMGHARALLALPPAKQQVAAQRVARGGLSVRATERLVRALLKPSRAAAKRRSPDPNVARLQDGLAEKLGAKVEIRHGTGGKGSIVIRYHSLEELDGILEHIK
jgi:ParB family chromosome partitioning protein